MFKLVVLFAALGAVSAKPAYVAYNAPLVGTHYPAVAGIPAVALPSPHYPVVPAARTIAYHPIVKRAVVAPIAPLAYSATPISYATYPKPVVTAYSAPYVASVPAYSTYTAHTW